MCDEELEHCIYHNEQPKNKKRGRPGNEASVQVSRVIKTRTFLRGLDEVCQLLVSCPDSFGKIGKAEKGSGNTAIHSFVPRGL